MTAELIVIAVILILMIGLMLVDALVGRAYREEDSPHWLLFVLLAILIPITGYIIFLILEG